MSPTEAPRRHTEGRPIVRRFVIKRLPLAILTNTPWKIRDRSRPAYLGHAESHAKAIEIVDRTLAQEQPASWHEYRDHAREYGIAPYGRAIAEAEDRRSRREALEEGINA